MNETIDPATQRIILKIVGFLVKVIFVQNMAFTNTQGHTANIITMWGNGFEGIKRRP